MYDVAQYVDMTVRTLYRYYSSIEYLAVDAAYVLLNGEEIRRSGSSTCCNPC